MIIVIDVGCARHGNDYSVERLMEMFKPNHLYGFDPYPITYAPHDPNGPTGPTTATYLHIEQAAAWLYDGEVGFDFSPESPLIAQVRDGATLVPCVDLARFIDELPEDATIILKLDAETSEFEILEHLLETGSINRVSRVLIEWHSREGGPPRRRAIEEGLRRVGVTYEQWRW